MYIYNILVISAYIEDITWLHRDMQFPDTFQIGGAACTVSTDAAYAQRFMVTC